MLITRIWERFRSIPADYLYASSDSETKQKIRDDAERYLKWKKESGKQGDLSRFHYCMTCCREFRSVFYYRVKKRKFLVGLSKVFLPAPESIEIGGDIDGGLMISHFHAVIFPERAGKNLRIAPGVVVGKNNGGFPIIGNNVYIAANAVVIGGITIGDNVVIGAGSVVTKDLPGNGIYIGNPARLVREIREEDPILSEFAAQYTEQERRVKNEKHNDSTGGGPV